MRLVRLLCHRIVKTMCTSVKKKYVYPLLAWERFFQKLYFFFFNLHDVEGSHEGAASRMNRYIRRTPVYVLFFQSYSEANLALITESLLCFGPPNMQRPMYCR